MPPLLADLIHARGCKLKCEKFLTLPKKEIMYNNLRKLKTAQKKT